MPRDYVVHEGARIYPGAVIGSGCKIQTGTCIFEGVVLEEDVFVGPNVTFTNVKRPRAFTKAEYFEKTLVKRGATIGAGAIIICGVTIGEYAFIGAGALITRDVDPYAQMVGSPAFKVGTVDKDGRPNGKEDMSNG